MVPTSLAKRTVTGSFSANRAEFQSFNSHWLDAMISSYNAEIALCRQELGSGASPQARALARTMLAERQSELAQLQQWHQDGQMGMMG